MSATDAGQPLDIQEQVARIRRAQVETDKLAEETRKFVAEQHKLTAEAQKFAANKQLHPSKLHPGKLHPGNSPYCSPAALADFSLARSPYGTHSATDMAPVASLARLMPNAA